MNRERRWTQFKVVSRWKCSLLRINQLYDNQIINRLCVSRCQRRFEGTFLMSATSNFVDGRSVKTCARISFLFPWSLSLLGQKVWLRHGESAYENIMSKHGLNRRWTLGIRSCTQSQHTLQSKAPYPWRRLARLTHTAAASSSSCPLPPPPPVSFCPSN